MSHDEELERAMHKIGALRYELELLQSENRLVREESDRHYQLWVDSQAELEEARRGSGAGMKAMLGLSDDLVAENARLKADVNELADGLKLASEVGIKIADEVTRLKAEVERLTDTLNKLVKTPPEATGGVRVKVDFWTQYGSRLPSSYETFWENAAKEGKQS